MEERQRVDLADLSQAIDAYHALLTGDLAEATQAQLDDQLRKRGLFFGERPLCTVLRPRFLTPDQYLFLQRSIAALLPAFDRAHCRAIEDAAFRAQFGLLDWEEQMLHHDPGFREPSPVSRLDAFFVPENQGLRFTEYNAETPAGAGFNDVLSEVFLGLPVMRRFSRQWDARPLLVRHHVMHALLDAHAEWAHGREAPRVGILDWREVPTFAEFTITAEHLRSHGIACVIADPREVEYREGRLLAGDFHITVIYKRVLLHELVERGGLDHPIIRAVREGAVCMVNPFRCKILHKKASLAVLSDERNGELFTAGQRATIDAFVPWTRHVEERKTMYRGKAVDLIPFIVEQRDRMVLKPNDEYGGTGIVLGWETDADGWQKAVKTALASWYVVQERVPVPSEPYPSWTGTSVAFPDRMLDTAPFIFHGEYMDGCLTRLSTAALLNVSAGGGSSVPTFVVERRAR